MIEMEITNIRTRNRNEINSKSSSRELNCHKMRACSSEAAWNTISTRNSSRYLIWLLNSKDLEALRFINFSFSDVPLSSAYSFLFYRRHYYCAFPLLYYFLSSFSAPFTSSTIRREFYPRTSTKERYNTLFWHQTWKLYLPSSTILYLFFVF